ncbi:MAG: anthranilate phosphoribosyltransferase [Planctomycetes bacterium]|nr:anthranilate phosphoribosyltransferase [Planctomycetota bacterium]
MLMIDVAMDIVRSGRDLEPQQMRELIEQVLTGSVPAAQMGEFLLELKKKGESVGEIAGAALAMREKMLPIRSCGSGILDTCGTGGDGSKTFNISTAAAIAAAAAGATVAKHGNRKVTSATGSADVLQALGIQVDADRDVVERCLDDLGLCFCYAPKLHPAMRHVAEVRKQLKVPTLFNLLGPLCNPAGAVYQVLGTGRVDLQDKLAAALQFLPIRRAWVVRGLDGVDEISISGPTDVIDVTPNSWKRLQVQPSDFGCPVASRDDLFADDPEQSAAVIRRVFAGERGACRDVVVINAAAALFVAGLEQDLSAAARRVEQAIDSGRAAEILRELARISQRA